MQKMTEIIREILRSLHNVYGNKLSRSLLLVK